MVAARGPWLLYALPILAVVVLGISVFTAASDQRMRSALVIGGPTDTLTPFRGRLQVVEERWGVAHPLSAERVRLLATSGSHRSSQWLTTDPDGWAEFEVAERKEARLHLQVLGEEGEVLAEGEPQLETARWAASARRRGGEGLPQTRGSLTASVVLAPRVLAVPFEAAGHVLVTRAGVPLSGAAIQLSSEGSELQGATAGSSGAGGVFRFRLRPQQHVASLRVVVSAGEERLEFDQLLPVVPGSFGFQQTPRGVRVLSPIPRGSAWFTFVRPQERLRGGRIALRANDAGGAEGEIPASAVPDFEGTFLVLSSEADGRSPSTVGFPLDDQARTFDAWDAYLLDGAPVVRAQILRQQRRIRWSLAAYAGACGFLTLLLFVSRVRRADRELTQRLREVGATAATGDQRALPLVVAVVCLFFAFSLAVVWIVAR